MKVVKDEFTNLPITPTQRWVLRHGEQKRERERRRYNPAKAKTKNKTFKETHPNYHKLYNQYRRLKDRIEIIQLLGSKCANPYNIDHTGFEKSGYYGFCLQIDHINGHGIQDKKTSQNNYYVIVLNKIRAGSKDYQLLCANCNWIKRHINNEK
jgi:hypothetical protein